MSSAALRVLIGDRNRYQRAMTELQRNLLVTNAGKEESRSGWPASLISLTCEQFDVGHGPDHGLVAERFLATMLVATPTELARTFRWPAAKARAHLDDLVDTGRARFDGSGYELLD